MVHKNKITLTRPCYTLAVVDGKKAELTMYGEIVESQPVDWWTGEPVDGQFIILKDFLADLEAIADCESIIIHLNSVGGDAFSAMAIHNRLREMKAEKTCIVDGVAMSGGSLIMCACDTVKVNPSSIVMIHDCWTVVWDRFNAVSARKMADELSVIDNSQAEIYVRKTGKTMEEVRAMMDKDTYMSGREAVENKFADELLEDEIDPEISVSADHRTLFACGHSLRIAAMGKLPDGLKVVETAPTSSVDNKPEASGNKGGTSMTLEELKKNDPEAYAAMIAEAQAGMNNDEAVQNERQRLADIDAVANLFDAETVNAAKYTNPCTAQEMCYRAAQKSVQQGTAFMAALNKDAKESGAEGITSAPAASEDDKPMTNADMVAAGEAAAKEYGKKKEA